MEYMPQIFESVMIEIQFNAIQYSKNIQGFKKDHTSRQLIRIKYLLSDKTTAIGSICIKISILWVLTNKIRKMTYSVRSGRELFKCFFNDGRNPSKHSNLTASWGAFEWNAGAPSIIWAIVMNRKLVINKIRNTCFLENYPNKINQKKKSLVLNGA